MRGRTESGVVKSERRGAGEGGGQCVNAGGAASIRVCRLRIDPSGRWGLITPQLRGTWERSAVNGQTGPPPHHLPPPLCKPLMAFGEKKKYVTNTVCVTCEGWKVTDKKDCNRFVSHDVVVSCLDESQNQLNTQKKPFYHVFIFISRMKKNTSVCIYVYVHIQFRF